MRRCKPLHVLVFVIILTGALPGCAAYSAYRMCGSRGCPGDARITAEVRALLNQHPALAPPNQVYVQTLDRVVYLTGQVATDLQRDTAESAAHEATGVSRVTNTIALTYAGR
jgi:osmotically-inducible protein OsmY